MTEAVGVTVVVPTLNRGGFLYNTLQDLLAQEHRPLEILVVDQSDSVPETVQQIASNHSDIISYHKVGFRGLPQARNYALIHARHDAIVYVDDDIRCGPTLAGEHLRALSQEHVGAAAGSINEKGRIPSLATQPGRFRYWTAAPERVFSVDGTYLVEHVPGCNFATWRTIACSIGGFDEAFNIGPALYEETEFCLRLGRAGYRIVYNGKARLDHLTAISGGCRVDQVGLYMWALAHNRTILIKRYLRWYHKPTAYAELLRLGLAYAFHYRQPRVLFSVLGGFKSGSTKPDSFSK